MDIFSLDNKIAVVTGAVGLLGQELCKALSNQGATVIVTDLNHSDCEEFAITLENDSIGIFMDITKRDSITKAKDRVLKDFGRIDILVNNAAVNDMVENPKVILDESKFENYPIELWNKSLEVNLTGTFLCSQIFGPVMADENSGSIINIASMYGIVAPNQNLYKDIDGNQKFYKPPAYSTTKGAVISFTKYLAAYWGSRNVRVNSITPGGIENNQDKYFIKKYSERTPLGKMADKSDFAGAVVYLASNASKYVTGSNIIVDGGWTCW
ncbi:MAG: SDR family oxidoreductase [Ignavibacteriales bacterium]|nr:SDR family oxidoreductase [Ignavibacteriales bacterium]